VITLITASIDEKGLETLRKYGEVRYQPMAETRQMLGGRRLVRALEDVDVFITEADNLREREFDTIENLQIVCSCRGNPVNIDIPAATQKGIPVLNAPGRNMEGVADLTIVLMIMLARNVLPAEKMLREREPGDDMNFMAKLYFGMKGVELWKMTVGIIGLGAIGQSVANRLIPFGAKLIGTDPYVSKETMAELGVEKVELDKLLKESDFVTLHVMPNEETKGMLGKKELGIMKETAFFINTARSALTDEAALTELLREKKIAGAGLDVYDKEPLPLDHPLMELDNVVLLPHIGGMTTQVTTHQTQIVVPAIEALINNEERPSIVVNPEVLDSFLFRK
jgi:D-3-phosphoglycerate dehydrogenase